MTGLERTQYSHTSINDEDDNASYASYGGNHSQLQYLIHVANSTATIDNPYLVTNCSIAVLSSVDEQCSFGRVAVAVAVAVFLQKPYSEALWNDPAGIHLMIPSNRTRR